VNTQTRPRTKPTDSPQGGLRIVTPGMQRLLWVAGGLVFLAGLQLFAFSERTEEYFAWTIDVPLTAAFLGAGYWASVALEWLAAREKLWANARAAVPSVFVFTTLTLVATLLHLDLFHLDTSFGLTTRAVTWIWIAIYASVPVLLLFVFVKQAREPGDDPAIVMPMPFAITAVLALHAVILTFYGLYLFLSPERAASIWPWPLTELTGRAVGAWVLSLGVAAGSALRERDLRRVRASATAYAVIGILQFVALARYPEPFEWSEPQGIVYVVMLASMVLLGAAAWWLGRDESRKKSPEK
jgi:hypothetical protein